MQFNLAEMCGLLLEDAGYSVQVEHNLGVTLVIHNARNSGDVDVHFEYTGSVLTILEMEDVADLKGPDMAPEEVVELVFDEVKARYADRFNAIWLDPSGINNTYALAMQREHAEELGVTKVSDLDAYAADLSLGGPQEFIARPDELPEIEEIYGFEFGGMESGMMYQALDNEDVDVIPAFSTDGRIISLDFVLLEDAKGFFPPYSASPVVRGELIEQPPEIEEVLNQMGGILDDTTMAQLNLSVDEGGEEVRPVAQRYLEEQGLLG